MHAHSIYKIYVRHILHMQGLSVRQFVGWVFLFSFLANVTKAHNLDTGIYHRHYHHYLPLCTSFYSFLSATLDHLFRCTGAEARETNKLSLSLSLSLRLLSGGICVKRSAKSRLSQMSCFPNNAGNAQPLAACEGQIPDRLYALLFKNKSQKIDEPVRGIRCDF